MLGTIGSHMRPPKFDPCARERYIHSGSGEAGNSSLLAASSRVMSVSYFKRYRMEIDLRGRAFAPIPVPPGYRLLPWHPDRLVDHAEAKYLSFRHEIDADVFTCLGDSEGCFKLMEEISDKEGFLPEATWLAAYIGNRPQEIEVCGTIQGVRSSPRLGGIQNIGTTPAHRRRGLGTALIYAALAGFQQLGLPRAYLEVTAQNEPAVRLYRQLGFQRVKTLHKAVEFAMT
jgi:RimJ/RimL family protein N-acetyltransferase